MAPIPKRSSERIRRNKVAPVTTIHAVGVVEVPPLGIEDPLPSTVEFWESLHYSAQSRFFEPSDWWMARFAARTIEQYERNPRRPALTLAEINKMMSALLMGEADRRRNRLEVERSAEQVDAPVGASASYRRVFGMEAV